MSKLKNLIKQLVYELRWFKFTRAIWRLQDYIYGNADYKCFCSWKHCEECRVCYKFGKLRESFQDKR